MVAQVLYVYAIAGADHPMPVRAEAVDGSDHLAMVQGNGLGAFYTAVDGADFSQAVIDARSNDVEWLGAIGYRHQAVMSALMRGGTIIPLRAFTLFVDETSLRKHLLDHRGEYTAMLQRLDGKEEWTLRVEFQPETWSEALTRRVESLRKLRAEMDGAASGKAYLLRKKLEEEKKKASREAEQRLLAEIEQAVMRKLACETVAESRLQRGGAFPQINVLANRDEEARLQELRDDLNGAYAADGVSVVLTGPWPPYSFTGTMNSER